MFVLNTSALVLCVKEDVNPTQNIRLQESTLLHLQSQGDKSVKCLTKASDVYAPHSVYMQHSITNTVQM